MERKVYGLRFALLLLCFVAPVILVPTGALVAGDGEIFVLTVRGPISPPAADIIDAHPAALQLRYLQTLAEIATENNSTTPLPIPIDLFRGIIAKKD